MTIQAKDGAIRLTGSCGHDDVEPLLEALAANPDWPIDLMHAIHLHGAILQVLIHAKRPIQGEAEDPFIGTWLLPALRRSQQTAGAAPCSEGPTMRLSGT